MRIAKRTRIIVLLSITGLLLLSVFNEPLKSYLLNKLSGKKSVNDIIALYGDEANRRLAPFFKKHKLSYPPQSLYLIGLKQERKLELWVNEFDKWHRLKVYPLTAFSGKNGPKLLEGDGQIPEGVYTLDALNPNSHFHLSLRINYPNEYDLRHARAESRLKPGNNIFIHGKSVSIGCLAIGDQAIEELFVLVAATGIENVKVIIAPYDFRIKPVDVKSISNPPVWLPELYQKIQNALLAVRPG